MEKLTDKGYRSYDHISRYSPFPYYFHTEDNRYVYGTTAQLNDSMGYALHTVAKGDTFDSLALDYYNSPTLYWVICDFNRIQDPYKKLEVGTKIKIPVLSQISFDIQ